MCFELLFNKLITFLINQNSKAYRVLKKFHFFDQFIFYNQLFNSYKSSSCMLEMDFKLSKKSPRGFHLLDQRDGMDYQKGCFYPSRESNPSGEISNSDHLSPSHICKRAKYFTQRFKFSFVKFCGLMILLNT